MADGYVRQSEADIQNDEVIFADDLNAEFDAIEAAFDVTNGHTHDGTTGGGAPISYTDLTNTPTLGNSSSLNVGTTTGTVAAGDDSRIVNAVPNTLTLSAGTGLTGGGNLTTNRTLSLSSGSISSLSLADSAVQPGDLATVATTGEAEDVSFVNIGSGLYATNVQDAIDEIDAKQSWELISRYGINTPVSGITQTNLANFESIRISGVLVPASNANRLLMRFSSDNGSTWISSSSYVLGFRYNNLSVAWTQGGGVITAINMNPGDDIGSAGFIDFDILLKRFNKNTPTYFRGSDYRLTSASLYFDSYYAGLSAGAIHNALNIYFDSSGAVNIASGFVLIEGLRA